MLSSNSKCLQGIVIHRCCCELTFVKNFRKHKNVRSLWHSVTTKSTELHTSNHLNKYDITNFYTQFLFRNLEEIFSVIDSDCQFLHHFDFCGIGYRPLLRWTHRLHRTLFRKSDKYLYPLLGGLRWNHSNTYATRVDCVLI